MYAGLISERILLDGSPLLNLRVVRRDPAPPVRAILQGLAILVNHQECSEHIQLVVFPNVVEHLLNLHDNRGIEGDTIGVHVVLHPPE